MDWKEILEIDYKEHTIKYVDFKKYTVKIYDSGSKEFFMNGQRHREDGPAVELINGSKQWWLNGELFSEKEYVKKIDEVKASM